MRSVLRMLLPALALLLLAAHFFRGGMFPLAAISFGLIALLPVSRPWASSLLRTSLALGTIEWLRTAWVLSEERALAGEPYARMLLILGAVAAFTLVAAWLAGRPARESRLAGRSV